MWKSIVVGVLTALLILASGPIKVEYTSEVETVTIGDSIYIVTPRGDVLFHDYVDEFEVSSAEIAPEDV